MALKGTCHDFTQYKCLAQCSIPSRHTHTKLLTAISTVFLVGSGPEELQVDMLSVFVGARAIENFFKGISIVSCPGQLAKIRRGGGMEGGIKGCGSYQVKLVYVVRK